MFKNNFIKGEIIIKKILEKLKNIKYILGLTLLFLSLGRALFSKTTSKVQEEYKQLTIMMVGEDLLQDLKILF